MGTVEIIEYYTYDDYKKWEGDWELINGVAYAMALSPKITHQALISAISSELFYSTKECKKCMVVVEQDWKIKEDTVLKPDVALICDETNENYITKNPLIVVEVVSPSSSKRDEVYKFDIYEKERVSYYILVYPNDLKAKLYRLENGKFSKEGDFINEEFVFEDLECKAKIDFKNVFERFRY